jgi:hypothetical protein
MPHSILHADGILLSAFHHFNGESTRVLHIRSDLKSQVRQLTQYTFFDIHVPINMDPRKNQHLIKRRGVFNVSLTRIRHFVAQFDRLGDKSEIKMSYGPLAEIWNEFVGF